MYICELCMDTIEPKNPSHLIVIGKVNIRTCTDCYEDKDKFTDKQLLKKKEMCARMIKRRKKYA